MAINVANLVCNRTAVDFFFCLSSRVWKAQGLGLFANPARSIILKTVAANPETQSNYLSSGFCDIRIPISTFQNLRLAGHRIKNLQKHQRKHDDNEYDTDIIIICFE